MVPIITGLLCMQTLDRNHTQHEKLPNLYVNYINFSNLLFIYLTAILCSSLLKVNISNRIAIISVYIGDETPF